MIRRLKDLNLNLGIPALLPEWRGLFTRQHLLADILAGCTVAFVAIPLSLAIALASGVPPGIGLITSIVAGIICALFGGTTLAVSGPAAAMAILLADNVEKFGLHGLIVIGLLTGLMQLVSGILGIGKLSRYVPLPVIAGFTAGIGVIILIGQLPRAFGLLPPAESHIFYIFKHMGQYIHDMNVICLLLVLLTFFIIRGLPKIFPKIPSILVAVSLVTAIVYFFHLKNVPLIGAIPDRLPTPSFPKITGFDWGQLILSAFVVYLLASLETLLSCSAVDKLSGGKKHDSNQELIGQGLGNIAVSFFGGMPATSVIARSMTNVKAGAKTRRSSIIHSLIILLAVFAISPIISIIPVVALAGVLFFIALNMINYKEFYALWKTSRSEGIIYALTFFTIIFVDLIAGVQVGIIAAALIVLLRATKTRLHVSSSSDDNTIRLSLTGALTFLSINEIMQLEKKLENALSGQTVIADFTHITDLDISGAAAIISMIKSCDDKDIRFYLKGLSRRFETLFQTNENDLAIDKYYLVSESELREKSSSAPVSFRGRLLHGVQRFYLERKHNDKRLFEYLAEKQDPHTLFITCSDSRIIPSAITSADPGELFIIRNVGNFIPPYRPDVLHGEAAALEFALGTLNITDVVVCGHGNCGAIQACQLSDNELSPKLKAWIGLIKSQLKLDRHKEVNDLSRENVLNQIHNLKQYPIVKARLADGSLNLHAWFFDFELGVVYEWNSQRNNFAPIVAETN